MVEMGQGVWGDSSVAGGMGGMTKPAKEVMSSEIVGVEAGCPSREWWAGLGTVTDALEGLGLVGFDLVDEGGKCLLRYNVSTPASSLYALRYKLTLSPSFPCSSRSTAFS